MHPAPAAEIPVPAAENPACRKLVIEFFAGLEDDRLSIDVGDGWERLPDGSRESRVTMHSLDLEKNLRGQGIASRALRRLTALADQLQVNLALEVGHDEADIDLIGWYWRLGFVFEEDGGMIRRPQSPDKTQQI